MDALLLLVLLEGERKVETQFLYILSLIHKHVVLHFYKPPN